MVSIEARVVDTILSRPNLGINMAEETSTLNRHDLEAKIVRHCWKDEAFREELAADPAGAFVKYLQVPAASLPKIVVHQEAPGFWHIVLPTKPANSEELSEADLEKIAGGWVSAASASIIAAAAAAAVVSAGAAATAMHSANKAW
jgi:hypothetical protein